VLWLTVLALDWDALVAAQMLIGRQAALSHIAFRTDRCEVLRIVRAAVRVRVDVIDAGTEFVQQRGEIAAPVRVVEGNRTVVAGSRYELLQEPHRGGEHDWAQAPTTQPAILLEDPHLDDLGDRLSPRGRIVVSDSSLRIARPSTCSPTNSCLHGTRTRTSAASFAQTH